MLSRTSQTRSSSKHAPSGPHLGQTSGAAKELERIGGAKRETGDGERGEKGRC